MFGLFKSAAISLDEQIRNLAACGITLRPDITKDDLLLSLSEAQYQKKPYLLLLCHMGGEVEQAPYDRIISDQLWHFDTECIEDHGAYTRIAERMRLLAGGDLPMGNIEDFVDVEEEIAWLSFDLDGRKIKWDAKVDNDWVDETIFSRFVQALKRRGSGKYFSCCVLGQDMLIGCWDSVQTGKINALLKSASLKFVPLE